MALALIRPTGAEPLKHHCRMAAAPYPAYGCGAAETPLPDGAGAYPAYGCGAAETPLPDGGCALSGLRVRMH